MPALTHSGSSSKPLMMFGADGTGNLTSPSNQLVSAVFASLYWKKGIYNSILIGIFHFGSGMIKILDCRLIWIGS